MSRAHNILVISDLHLGEDLAPTATEASRRDLALAERKLLEFLDYYTRHRMDGLPWRLVVNGDMVDFLGIAVDPSELAGDELTAEERLVGPERRERVAIVQMKAVIERHAAVMRGFARFLAVGNRVDIVCGNHDTELHWESVQAVFHDGVLAALPRGSARERVRDGLAFHPWFFYEPGVAWIEHGHQYDECCSHDFGLQPVGPDGAIVANVDTAGMRHVTNQLAEAEPHGVDEWSFGGYVRFAIGLGARGALQLIRGYCRFARQLVRVWRTTRSARFRRARAETHRARLRELAVERGVAERALRAIDKLRRRPVVASLRRLAQVLMIDRLSIYALGALVMLVALAALPTAAAIVVAMCAITGAVVGARVATRGRSVDPSVPLALAPARILDQVDAAYVVFGHTHEPEAHALGDGRWYFNTGTWLPTGKPGVLRSFTHVLIRGAGRANASLCQWRDGKSRAFTPGWSPVPALRPSAQPAIEPATVPISATAQCAGGSSAELRAA